MRLTDATVAIRPRSPWEAVDLGVLMAREHRRLLTTSWALLTLPVFVLLSLALWDYPSLAFLVFWWLKPAFDRLPLAILSQTLFGTRPTLGEALRLWWAALRPQLLPSLTYRRFSLSRSFTLPVQQLERLSGDERSQRLFVLGQGALRAPRCLTLVGSSLEMCLWFAAMMLLYALIPQQTELNWNWLSLLGNADQLNWLEHLTNLFYALVLVVWEPIYVACGFSLYLNRRTHLEAWDIELTFRRLRQRLAGVALLCLLGLTLVASPLDTTWAASNDTAMCPLPPLDSDEDADQASGPDAARLIHQPLTSSAARGDIDELLENPPFRNPVTTSGWRLKQDDPKSAATDPRTSAAWLRSLLKLVGMATEAIKVMLWALLILAVLVLVWRYRLWLATFVTRLAPGRQRHPRRATAPAFAPRLDEQALPDDIAGTAERLWQSDPRRALALLYQGMLTRLLDDYRVPLADAFTEGEVLAQVDRLGLDSLSVFAHQLAGHWQNLAYGHRLPSADAQRQLCDQWRRLFDGATP